MAYIARAAPEGRGDYAPRQPGNLIIAWVRGVALTLEMFSRQNMGVRHFTLVKVVLIFGVAQGLLWCGTAYQNDLKRQWEWNARVSGRWTGRGWWENLSGGRFLGIFPTHHEQRLLGLSPLQAFFWLFLLVGGGKRAAILRRVQEGKPPVHSYSSGDSEIQDWFPGVSEAAIKRYFEPAVWGGLGLLAFWASASLAWYLLFASSMLFLKEWIEQRQDWHRRCDVGDAFAEQGWLGEVLRGRR